MPYIKREDRQRAAATPENQGELNYALTLVLTDYMCRKGLRYAHINDCLGALEGAKLEFYRRVAAPYEDAKIEENGDVYNVGGLVP